MTHKMLTVLSASLAIALVGCVSTDPMTGSTRNEVISVQYGTVQNIQQVAMAPSYGTGALIGGALGLLAASSGSTATQVGGAAAGAGLGALVAKESAGSAEKFTVSLVNGSTIDIVTEYQTGFIGHVLNPRFASSLQLDKLSGSV